MFWPCMYVCSPYVCLVPVADISEEGSMYLEQQLQVAVSHLGVLGIRSHYVSVGMIIHLMVLRIVTHCVGVGN